MPLNYSTWLQESWACLSKDLWWYFRYRVLHPTDLFWILFTTAGKIPGSCKPLLFLLSFGWIVKKNKRKKRVNFVDIWQAHIVFHQCQNALFPPLTSRIPQFHLCLTNQCVFVIFSFPHLQDGTARSLESLMLLLEWTPSDFNVSDWLFLSFRGISDACFLCTVRVICTCKAKSVPPRETETGWLSANLTRSAYRACKLSLCPWWH